MQKLGFSQWVLIFSLFTLIGISVAATTYMRIPSDNEHHDLGKLLVFNLFNWYVWALSTPIIASLVYRFPLISRRWGRNLTIHFLVAMLFLLLAGNIRFFFGGYFWNYFTFDTLTRERYLSAIMTRLFREWPIYLLIVSLMTSYIAYLSKVITRESLKKTLSRLSSVEKELSELRSSNEPDKEFLSTISVKERDNHIILPLSDVYIIEAFDNYLKCHTLDKVYLYKGTMKVMEARLDPKQFVRIHRSFIVNIQKIHTYEHLHHGEYLLQVNNMELKLSRSYRHNLRRIIDR